MPEPEGFTNVGTPTVPVVAPETPGINTNTAFLIVGDRAYKTQDDLVKHLTHQESFIDTLKQEKVTEVEKLTTLLETSQNDLRDANDKAQRASEMTPTTPAAAVAATPTTVTQAPAQEMSADRILEVVKADKQNTTREENFNESLAACKEVWGDDNQKVNDALAAVATTKGVTVQYAQEMARYSPKLFKETFLGIKGEPSPNMLSGGSTSTTTPKQPNEGETKKYEASISRFTPGHGDPNKVLFEQIMVDEKAKAAAQT